MTNLETQMSIHHYRRQGLSYRAIARKTGCDRRTVKKYVEHPERPNQPRQTAPRPSKLDPYRVQIAAYLAEDPQYRATWIYDRLVAQGYTGGYEIVKVAVRQLKDERQRLAYVRFETEPGQQAQVDFGEHQVVQPDGTVRKVYQFSLILGYSRQLYGELLDRCDLPHFLDALQRAFAVLGGVPREILFDRMRNVFIRRLAGEDQFTQGLMTLAQHYGFTPRVAPAYAPWVKGKVERPFDFIREGFWRGYRFTELATANRDLQAWLAQKAQRMHGTTHERVDTRFAREQPHLGPLPPAPCDVSLRLVRMVAKDCTIAVEGNRYVVPHTLVGRQVVVRIKDDTLRVYDGDVLVVTYAIPEGRGALVQDPRFYAALRQDRALNARKYAVPPTGKGKATISPTRARHPVEVSRRSLAEYDQIGGEVRYA
jgi:transposase